MENIIQTNPQTETNTAIQKNKTEERAGTLEINGLEILEFDFEKMSKISDSEFESQTISDIYNQMTEELKKFEYEEFRFLSSDTQGCQISANKKGIENRHIIKGIFSKKNKEDANELKNYIDNQIKILKQCSGSPYSIELVNEIEGEEMVYLIFNANKGTIQKLLEQQGGKLSEFSVIKYSKDIAEGICHAHKNGHFFYHLNLDQIFIDFNNNAVVSAFTARDLNLSQENSLFIAPEIEQNSQEQDASDNTKASTSLSKQSDAFSFGCLMISMLLGVTELKRYEKKKEQISEYFANLSDSSSKKESLYKIISRLTKFDSNERMTIFDSLSELQKMISVDVIAEQEVQDSGDEHIKNIMIYIEKVQKKIGKIGEKVQNLKPDHSELLIKIQNFENQIKLKDQKIDDLTKQLLDEQKTHENEKKKLKEGSLIKDEQIQKLNQELEGLRIEFKKKENEIILKNQSLMKELEESLRNQLRLKVKQTHTYQGPGFYCNDCNYYFGQKWGYHYGNQVSFYCSSCQSQSIHTLKR
ncbi:kinase domain protein (macronuclear) [Tetrahymena thermophila SB210]|uniref:Kinase domain protein n=1 Tax=Tetrahymena thermophila (strain SB210) TaxID=312017 RepID=Q22Y27_TETTS|nr:kinase domain protein [Tetrahymena thermophila SB210]EAR90197.2 kinase domain protein [Tetrahymena thermophila SB210]|eukprot:XP_001010442.2 kinase domain protein [Tetrahymena thermophila SB210]